MALLLSLLSLSSIASVVEFDKDGNIISGYSTDVHEKGWVSEKINHKMILKNNNVTSSWHNPTRNFKNKITLAFVTPWHAQGYKWSANYAKKFTHISPVWYDIEPIPSTVITSYMLKGDSNVDIDWIKSVRLKNERIQIIPRYTLKSEQWSLESIEKFFKQKKAQKELISVLVKSLRNKNNNNGYNGCVLEITPFWNYLAHIQRQYSDKQITRKAFTKQKKKFEKFIETVCKRLRKSKKYIFLVLSPYHIQLSVNWNKILKYVRCIVLMTYDFSVNQSNQQSVVGNAPLSWLRDIIETIKQKSNNRHEWKFLMGLNFYGYTHKQSSQSSQPTYDPIIGDQLLKLLEKEGDDYEWKWNEEIMEHVLSHANDDSVNIYYPTLMSVAARIELASMYNIGISIWELGQGMEYFIDLL